MLPNGKYTISIEDSLKYALFYHSSFHDTIDPFFMNYPCRGLRSQELITDGNPETILLSDDNSIFKTGDSDLRGKPIFPGNHKLINVSEADTVIIQGYEGAELVSSDLYTVAEGERVEKYRTLALTPGVGEMFSSNTPYVRRIINK